MVFLMKALLHTLATSLLLIAGCSTFKVMPIRFRTMQPETAFDRALSSLQAHTGKVQKIDHKNNLIYSRWMEGSQLAGHYYQFIALVLPDKADQSASVTIKMRVVRCNLITKMSDDKARWCEEGISPTKSEVIAFDEFSVVFRKDVFRFQE